MIPSDYYPKYSYFVLLSYLAYNKMPDSSIINYEKTNFEISVADFLIPVLYF